MKYDEVTLNYFFRNLELPAEKSKSIDSSGKIEALKISLSGKGPKAIWTLLWPKIVESCPKLLDIKLKDLLIGGWKKYELVENYKEEGKAHPEVTYSVPLMNHTMVSEHHPQIEISYHKAELGTLNFTLLLKLELSGLILNIRGGKIDGVKAGTCKCKGSLAMEDVVLFEDSSETFEF
jgi:hypothetical protein